MCPQWPGRRDGKTAIHGQQALGRAAVARPEPGELRYFVRLPSAPAALAGLLADAAALLAVAAAVAAAHRRPRRLDAGGPR